MAQALTAATAIRGDSERARTLTGLAPHLPADQQPAVLAQALSTATAISEESDRAQALTDLTPLLPPDLLILAFAAATAIRSSSDRAKALTGLVPHLPPDLLASALESAPKNSAETLTALWQRSRFVYPNDKHLTYIELFRKSTCGAGRSVCFDILAECSSIISEIGGSRSIEQCVHAVMDVSRWWP